MTAAPFRVGIVGYGLAGRVFHAPLVVTTADLELVGIVTRDGERRAQATVDHPDAPVVPDLTALLRLAPDIVVVASSNASHVELASACVRAGVAVVVDKPLGRNAAEAAALVERAASAGVLLAPFHNRRWDADFRTLQTLVSAGSLGDVRRFESRFERWRPESPGRWRESADPAMGGGLLLDLGAHLVDQALVLLGPVRRVYAELSSRRVGPDGRPGGDDDVFVALDHASGAVSHLWASAVAAAPGPRLRVLGSAAAYRHEGLDPQEDELRAGRLPGTGWGAVPPEGWGHLVTGDRSEPVAALPGDYPAFYRLLAEAVRTGGAPPVEPVEAVDGLRVLDAARTSAATRQVVRLDQI